MRTSRTAAFVGLGSNLDDPARQVGVAIARLRALTGTRLTACSRLYRNPPMGPPDQPDYVNAVAALETALEARALLSAFQHIERIQGRVRDGRRWGPRIIDLDLLLYGEEIIAEPGLAIPHPGLAQRAFVLVPLHEIAPRVFIPGHPSLRDLLAAVDSTGVVPLAEGATAT